MSDWTVQTRQQPPYV